MQKSIRYLSIAGATAGLVLTSSAAVQAKGVPQRSSDLPPGLTKVFAKEVPGIIQALTVVDGSNSRLLDVPVSP